MILIIHQKSQNCIKVLNNGNEINLEGISFLEIFWQLATKYPEDIIAWCEEEFENELNPDSWKGIFHHDLIMASYAVKTAYLPEAIGYIDQLPFVNVNRDVEYATWRMSTDIGGIKGKVLMKFQTLFGQIRDFGLLLDSIAKLGQQNGLFCYSAPLLIKQKSHQPTPNKIEGDELIFIGSNNELFSFVYSHYKSIRLWLIFWCFVKYEKSFPVLELFLALFQPKYFKKEIDLSDIPVKSLRTIPTENIIDVIIPSLGRREYLLQVLEDLRVQTLLPKKVIIVEQNPHPNSQSELPELKAKEWPFELVHLFIHQTGACNARNLALDEVDADWVFFADDDNSMENDVLEKALQEIKRLGVKLLTLKYSQEGESLIFDRVKQWGTFGSGNSIVLGSYASKIRFDKAFEFGYGEDKDYGMQLRNVGCDIIYHPAIEILHLKAPRGGFRKKIDLPWDIDNPKPSPTLMVYAKKHYSKEQLRGFKTELFIRFYSKQEVKNPFKYFKMMRARWRKSEEWAKKLRNGTKIILETKIPDEV